MEKYKNLIQYCYSCSNAFFIFLQDGDKDALTLKLGGIETHAFENLEIEDKEGMSLWFKFGHDYALATDIGDIINDLSLHDTHPNRLFMLDNLKRVTKDINPDNELRVFYS
tara:strand:+ start:683 stop:1015 length:333 start_codon:yes stop_codon:yes gene_type:complete